MTLEAGTRVGKYEVRDLIGEGGMGRVYRALDTELVEGLTLREHMKSHGRTLAFTRDTQNIELVLIRKFR